MFLFLFYIKNTKGIWSKPPLTSSPFPLIQSVAKSCQLYSMLLNSLLSVTAAWAVILCAWIIAAAPQEDFPFLVPLPSLPPYSTQCHVAFTLKPSVAPSCLQTRVQYLRTAVVCPCPPALPSLHEPARGLLLQLKPERELARHS